MSDDEYLLDRVVGFLEGGGKEFTERHTCMEEVSPVGGCRRCQMAKAIHRLRSDIRGLQAAADSLYQDNMDLLDTV